MAAIPPPYDRFVKLDPGEEPLDCWFGMLVRVERDGKVVNTKSEQTDHGRRPATIDKRAGLVLLTDRRLCFYLRCEQAGTNGGRPHAHLEISVPLPSIERMSILTSLTHRVVQLRLAGVYSYAERDWRLLDHDQTGDVNFDMALGVRLDRMLSLIQSAGERCPAPLSSSSRS